MQRLPGVLTFAVGQGAAGIVLASGELFLQLGPVCLIISDAMYHAPIMRR
jgi:hypothetical protein